MTRSTIRNISLTQYLIEQQRQHGHIPQELRLLIEVVARACKRIAIQVNKGELGDVLGNVSGTAPGALSGPVLFKSCGWAGWDLAAARVAMGG